MKRIEHSVLLAGLLAFGLAACTTGRMGMGDTAATSPTESATGVSYGTPSTTGTGSMGSTAGTASTATGAGTETTGTGAMGTTTTDPQSAGSQASTTGAAPMTPNSVVTMIEVVPRSEAATGAGTMAGAAVGGTAGAAGDRVYRVTLRMDDGSTRVITQESAPTFRSGDRVNLSGGEIRR